MAAVAERRLLGLLAAAERHGEVARRGVAQRPMRGAAMPAVAIGLPGAAPADAPDDQLASRDLCAVGPVGGVAHRRPMPASPTGRPRPAARPGTCRGPSA